MLADIVLNIIYFVIGGFINLIPDASIQLGSIGGAFVAMNAYSAGLRVVFPLTEFVAILGIVIIIETAIFGFGIFNWFIRKIPGVN
jgi:hypothetical protein